ncbi:MAG: hypothetical protein H8E66_15555 [Planctomycetes bacterium]|nr:hypothetical protein [Planctomycetota bacterium]
MKLISISLVIALIQFDPLNGLSADTIQLTDTTSCVFTSVEAGQAALRTPDRYTTALSRFDLESRLKTNDAVTTKDLMKFSAEQVIAWSDADRAKMESVIASVAKRFADYALPFPPEILLIQTTGKEEGGAAYCRRHAVILPRPHVGFRESQLEKIFIHELFHVLSSHNEPLRRSLYEIIGFKPCPEVTLPESLVDFKITNPDGPSLRYYIELDVDGQDRLAVPLLYSPERFDPKQNRSFFGYLKFQLLVVRRNGNDWSVVEESGKPILLDPKKTPSFHQQIGGNTKYIIHPDEVLADNFMHLIMQKQDLPNPEIVSTIKELLRADK